MRVLSILLVGVSLRLRDVGGSRAQKAIPDRKVLQAHKVLKECKACRALKDKLELRGRRGRRALLAKRVRKAIKETKERRGTKVILVRETRATGARKVKKEMQVHQSALFRSMDR
jgi:hypothetical protein